MYYRWVLYLHIGSALAMLGLHGTSMVVLFRIRRERDRGKIHALLTLSGETAVPLYVSLLLIVVSGVLAGLYLESFSDWWIWLAILLLVGTVGYMTAVAKPYFAKIKGACEMRPSGVPRVSDEELEELLSSNAATKITLVGAGALLVILYLMIFKPGVG